MNDDELVTYGLEAMLRPYDDRIMVVCPVGEALAEPIDAALYEPFAMDQSTPTVTRLLADPCVPKVVVYTWNFQPWLAKDAIAAGASGYLAKRLPAHELVEALEAVHAGQTVVSLAPSGNRSVGAAWPGREAGLTLREAEVLSFIAMGLANPEIARRTFLSVNSVKTYIRSCYRKIGVDNRTKAVLWAVAHGVRPVLVDVSTPSLPARRLGASRRVPAQPGRITYSASVRREAPMLKP